jgi:AcrR family transcriptional regulator
MEARRQQILDAASACFSRQGFHQTTMQDICREADLSPGAVYRYFASKEEIISASCEDCQGQNQALVEAVFRQSEDTLELLDLLTDAGFGLLHEPEAQEQMRMNIQFWAEALRSPDVLEGLGRPVFGTWRNAFAGIIEQAQQRGQVNPSLEPESVGQVLLSSWLGLVLQKAFDPQVDIGDYVTVMKALHGGRFWLGPQAPT